jgi:hypothetical protein
MTTGGVTETLGVGSSAGLCAGTRHTRRCTGRSLARPPGEAARRVAAGESAEGISRKVRAENLKCDMVAQELDGTGPRHALAFVFVHPVGGSVFVPRLDL